MKKILLVLLTFVFIGNVYAGPESATLTDKTGYLDGESVNVKGVFNYTCESSSCEVHIQCTLMSNNVIKFSKSNKADDVVDDYYYKYVELNETSGKISYNMVLDPAGVGEEIIYCDHSFIDKSTGMGSAITAKSTVKILKEKPTTTTKTTYATTIKTTKEKETTKTTTTKETKKEEETTSIANPLLLKNLIIEGYEIDFDPNKFKYEIKTNDTIFKIKTETYENQTSFNGELNVQDRDYFTITVKDKITKEEKDYEITLIREKENEEKSEENKKDNNIVKIVLITSSSIIIISGGTYFIIKMKKIK